MLWIIFIVLILIIFLIARRRNTRVKVLPPPIKKQRMQQNYKRIEPIIWSRPINKAIVVNKSDYDYYRQYWKQLFNNRSHKLYGPNTISNNISNNVPNAISNNVPNAISNNFPGNVYSADTEHGLLDILAMNIDNELINVIENDRMNLLLNDRFRNEYEHITAEQNEQITRELFTNPGSQNVHDSSVQSTIKSKYSKTDKNQISDPEYIFEEILKCANDENKKNRISKILNEIRNRNAYVENLKDTETNILCNTWKKSDKIVKDQIINEIIDCYENNKLVCPTGVVSRIVNADIVTNPDNTPKTIEVIREEMLNIASKLRTDMESDEEYNKKSDNDKAKDFKDLLIKEYENTYKDIIDMSIIKDEYSKWINNI